MTRPLHCISGYSEQHKRGAQRGGAHAHGAAGGRAHGAAGQQPDRAPALGPGRAAVGPRAAAVRAAAARAAGRLPAPGVRGAGQEPQSPDADVLSHDQTD